MIQGDPVRLKLAQGKCVTPMTEQALGSKKEISNSFPFKSKLVSNAERGKNILKITKV
jgi:hypothetical protein